MNTSTIQVLAFVSALKLYLRTLTSTGQGLLTCTQQKAFKTHLCDELKIDKGHSYEFVHGRLLDHIVNSTILLYQYAELYYRMLFRGHYAISYEHLNMIYLYNLHAQIANTLLEGSFIFDMHTRHMEKSGKISDLEINYLHVYNNMLSLRVCSHATNIRLSHLKNNEEERPDFLKVSNPFPIINMEDIAEKFSIIDNPTDDIDRKAAKMFCDHLCNKTRYIESPKSGNQYQLDKVDELYPMFGYNEVHNYNHHSYVYCAKLNYNADYEYPKTMHDILIEEPSLQYNKNADEDAFNYNLLYEYELHYKGDLNSAIHTMPLVDSLEAFKFLETIIEKPVTFRECMYAVFLATNNTVLGWLRLSIGGLNTAIVDVRHLTHYAILSNCSSVILAHNHPSGNLEPSKSDYRFLQNAVDGLSIFGIQVMDSLIIGYVNNGITKELKYNRMDIPKTKYDPTGIAEPSCIKEPTIGNYNGWTNYPTYRVALEFFNSFDEDLPLTYKPGINAIELSKQLKETVIEYLRSEFDNNSEKVTFFTLDYAIAWLDDVNFYEIAEYILANK
jgi:DNA repair protein RadC